MPVTRYCKRSLTNGRSKENRAVAGNRNVGRSHGHSIGWEGVRNADGLSLMQQFPSVQFTDYTKSVKRALAYAQGKFPSNYSLCFSRSETNEAQCIEVLNAGGTVAVVFGCDKPSHYLGFPVVDGDLHDLRFLDPRGHVVALTPKGNKAKKDKSGFVVRSIAMDLAIAA